MQNPVKWNDEELFLNATDPVTGQQYEFIAAVVYNVHWLAERAEPQTHEYPGHQGHIGVDSADLINIQVFVDGEMVKSGAIHLELDEVISDSGEPYGVQIRPRQEQMAAAQESMNNPQGAAAQKFSEWLSDRLAPPYDDSEYQRQRSRDPNSADWD